MGVITSKKLNHIYMHCSPSRLEIPPSWVAQCAWLPVGHHYQAVVNVVLPSPPLPVHGRLYFQGVVPGMRLPWGRGFLILAASARSLSHNAVTVHVCNSPRSKMLSQSTFPTAMPESIVFLHPFRRQVLLLCLIFAYLISEK